MLEEIKKIKLEELNKQKTEYEDKAEQIMQRYNQIASELSSLQIEQTKGITIRDDFSFLQKWITKRKEYKRFKAQSKRFAKLPKLISQVEGELEEESERYIQALETSGISTKLIEIEQKMYSIKLAKTLYEIGITPIDAIELLESNGIQPILSEADKGVVLHPRDYSSKSSLIGVHKTRYAPTANMIKSSKDSNVEDKGCITLNGVQYEYSFKAARDTVHMAMNDEVSSHMYGSWENCKYAVLIPFEDIANEKIGCAAPMDTFTRGSIELSENTWILCPKDEAQRLKIFNPKVHVLGYEGESVTGYSNPFLTQLGYRGENVGAWSWSDKKSTSQFYELMKKEGIKIGTHSYTYFHEDEQILTSINQAVALSKLLRDNHLITSPEDIKNIMTQLENTYQGYESVLSELCTGSLMVSDIEPQAIKGNNKQVDIFLEEMGKNGFNISTVYQNILRRLSEVTISRCSEADQNVVFYIPEEASEEERKTIEELQSVLGSDEYKFDNTAQRNAFGKFISTVMYDSILRSSEKEISKEASGQEIDS